MASSLCVLPRHALAGEDLTTVWSDAIENPKTGRPIGSGPFVLSRLERGRQITLVRNPRYWGRAAYLDRIVHRFMSADPRDPLAPLRGNEVDLGLTLGTPATLTADAAREIGSLPGWQVSSWPGVLMEHFMFRVGPGGHPALGSRLVRQALAYGIDRVAIAREIQQEAPHRDAARSTAPFSSPTSPSTGRRGAGTATTSRHPAACSSRPVAVEIRAASTRVQGSG